MKGENVSFSESEARRAPPMEAPASVRPVGNGVVATPASKKRPWLMLLGAVAVALLATGGYAWHNAGVETTDNAQVLADQIAVAPRITGTIVRVAVADNQPVKAGDLLFEIESDDYAARVAEAEADVATMQAQADAAEAQIGIVEASSTGSLVSARAALQGSTNTVFGANAQLGAARAAVERAEIEMRKSELDYQRAVELRAAHAIAQEKLEVAEAARDGARASLTQSKSQLTYAEEALRTAQRRVGEARGRVGQSAPVDLQIRAARANAALAKGRLQAAQAALTIARRQLAYTKVTAPTEGTVSRIVAHVGQFVSAGQPMAQLVFKGTYVVANFKEDQIRRMRPGQRVAVELDAFPGRTLTGRVSSLAAGTGAVFSVLAPDNATGNFIKVVQRVPVRIDWQSEPQGIPLRSGLSAGVQVYQ
jgi:membrane fusion protein, multidrug efflux system